MEAGFLAEKEVHKIRPLWETVFSEDSEAFTEYYFKNKAEHNLVFTRMDEEKIVSMLHLTPYLTGDLESVCYIVGVATDVEYRRRGLMADMMKEALQFMWEEGQPFTFLMPANPLYYTPFGFTYIYDKPEWKLNEEHLPARYLKTAAANETSFQLLIKEKGLLRVRTVKEADMKVVAEFANARLKEISDCYMLRNPHYYKIMKQELIAQNGNLFLIEKEERICGLISFTEEQDKPGLQEVILSADLENYELVATSEKKPAIMGRMIRTEECLNSLECEGKLDVLLYVRDDIVEENAGVYRLHCQSGGGRLSCKKVKAESKTDCSISIDALTSFCFGYKKARECFIITEDRKETGILESLEQIKGKKSIFINEII